jgi:hypothetical protein
VAETTTLPAAGSKEEGMQAAERGDAPARVVAVQESLVTIQAGWEGGRQLPLKKNEVVFIEPGRPGLEAHRERLEAEVLRVRGDLADAQVFEDTSGVAVGDPVRQSGEMLSVVLGPGLLGQVYDGLQNPLESIAIQHGTFLPRAGAPVDCWAPCRKAASRTRFWCHSISRATSRSPGSRRAVLPSIHRWSASATRAVGNVPWT